MRIACVRQTTFSSVLIDLDAPQVNRYASPVPLPVGTRVRTPKGSVIEQTPWGTRPRALMVVGADPEGLPLIAGGEYVMMRRNPATGSWTRVEALINGERLEFPVEAPEPGSIFARLAQQYPRVTEFTPGYCDDRPYCE